MPIRSNAYRNCKSCCSTNTSFTWIPSCSTTAGTICATSGQSTRNASPAASATWRPRWPASRRPGSLVRPHRRLRSARRAYRDRPPGRHGGHQQRPVFVHRRGPLWAAAFGHHGPLSKAVRCELFQGGWHFFQLQRRKPRPPGRHLRRCGGRPIANRHFGTLTRPGPQRLSEYHDQHLAQPVVAAMGRHGVDGRRGFRVSAVACPRSPRGNPQ